MEKISFSSTSYRSKLRSGQVTHGFISSLVLDFNKAGSKIKDKWGNGTYSQKKSQISNLKAENTGFNKIMTGNGLNATSVDIIE